MSAPSLHPINLTAEALLNTLAAKQIHCWVDGTKLRMRVRQGSLDSETLEAISRLKSDLVQALQDRDRAKDGNVDREEASWPCVIGALIGGVAGAVPVLEPTNMARQLRVTFRPLPATAPRAIAQFVRRLAEILQEHGVRVVPWDEAVKQGANVVDGNAPSRSGREKSRKIVANDINAVIDVERAWTARERLRVSLAETFYRWTLAKRNEGLSITQVLHRIAWIDDDLLNRLEDPFRTQIVVVRALDEAMLRRDVTYREKIRHGLKLLFRSFAQIALQVSHDKLAVVNLNLCDSIYPLARLSETVLTSLIPKLYVPIRPIPIKRFTLASFQPENSRYAERLIELGQRMRPTGLFPAGSTLSKVIRRRSRRDIFEIMADGRAGVSYGFVAYAEPPRYADGPIELSRSQWANLRPLPQLAETHVRQSDTGRWFISIGEGDQTRFHQVPDLWIISSRSGANKTDLRAKDVVRVGLSRGSLTMQSAEGTELAKGVRPSYDLYVMFALALGAALYFPSLIREGAPMVHFHGYPSPDWFAANEQWAGALNPSMPCGTFESGIFNFLAIAEVARRSNVTPDLITVVEPDHGVNILAADPDHLVARVNEGVASRQIELGGRFYQALKSHQREG
ncbi:hypothetical protein [Rhizobium sp. NLR22b]|uniref:hypothetical protein n=1 Tax=Rhizobium sp. NLR22b TaxID=2731115 RepID=UPI001C838055|nr:hypothetical protein [Rhizobium sp. NLR22b]MBX5242866.1 non-ribosomal peptide synthase [Rhizobium sp. NLR22b]